MSTLILQDVAAAAGIAPQLLRDWVNDEVPGIEPALRGGKNRHHRFSIVQAVGIVVAARLRNSERGCALSYVASVVAAFGNVSEEWLEAQFAKKCTHFLTVHGGRPVLTEHRYDDQIDVKAAHRAVARAVAQELVSAK